MAHQQPTDQQLDAFVNFREQGARIVGVDDDRPYAVELTGEDGKTRTYWFPDRDQAREFVRVNVFDKTARFYTTPEAAAKRYAKDHGVTGRPGGWIYSRTGQPITQGWASYAARLQQLGRLHKVAGRGYMVGTRTDYRREYLLSVAELFAARGKRVRVLGLNLADRHRYFDVTGVVLEPASYDRPDMLRIQPDDTGGWLPTPPRVVTITTNLYSWSYEPKAGE